MARRLPALPFGPLEWVVHVRATEAGRSQHAKQAPWLPRAGPDLVVELRVSNAMVRKWRAEGLDCWWADRAATRLGLHPHEIWGHEWEEACDAAVEREWGRRLDLGPTGRILAAENKRLGDAAGVAETVSPAG